MSFSLSPMNFDKRMLGVSKMKAAPHSPETAQEEQGHLLKMSDKFCSKIITNNPSLLLTGFC
jgi:hypothetical protein